MIVNHKPLPTKFVRANPKATSADDRTAPMVDRETTIKELRMKVING